MRYVYCALYEGFNDILCQVGLTWEYARRHGRTLVVDTRRSALHDDLGTYFKSVDADIILSPSPSLYRHLNTLSAYPPLVSGMVDMHDRERLPDGRFVLPGTAYEIAFRFDRDYAEDVLVHHAFGGGDTGVFCLARLRLRPALAESIRAAISPLGDSYHAVHVRNTDHRTDYMPYFKSIFPHVAGKTLLVCSDDLECREKARRFFAESTVMTVTDIPQSTDTPLHRMTDDVPGKNLAMLTDLFALAGAERLFAAPLVNGELSGFSLLALKLRQYHRIRDAVLGMGG